MLDSLSLHRTLDRIEIKGLRIDMIIGVLEEEKQTPQPIELDISLFADLSKACKSDHLTDTIDYGRICTLVQGLAHQHQDALLEKFADRVASSILHEPNISEVEVSVKKLKPPIASPLNFCSVTLFRSRSNHDPLPGQHTVLVALGSNLGDRAAHLRYALRQLETVTSQSQVFQTKPVGGPSGQEMFYNMVAAVQTSLDPYALLRKCHEIEAGAHRKREVHWGARTLDVDILFYDGICIKDPILTIPHPRIYERGFVLAPLSEVAPERLPPDWKHSLHSSEITPIGPLDDLS